MPKAGPVQVPVPYIASVFVGVLPVIPCTSNFTRTSEHWFYWAFYMDFLFIWFDQRFYPSSHSVLGRNSMH